MSDVSKTISGVISIGAMGATGGILAVSLANPALSIATRAVVVAGAAIGATQIIASIAIGFTAHYICECIDAPKEVRVMAAIILGLFGAIVAGPYLLGLAGMHFTRNVIFLSAIGGFCLTGAWAAVTDK